MPGGCARHASSSSLSLGPSHRVPSTLRPARSFVTAASASPSRARPFGRPLPHYTAGSGYRGRSAAHALASTDSRSPVSRTASVRHRPRSRTHLREQSLSPSQFSRAARGRLFYRARNWPGVRAASPRCCCWEAPEPWSAQAGDVVGFEFARDWRVLPLVLAATSEPYCRPSRGGCRSGLDAAVNELAFCTLERAAIGNGS